MKFIFHIANILLIVFYLFPGSILGCLLYNDCKIQPQLTPDFIVSSNHVYVFTIISLLGFVAYAKNKAFTIIISYFFFIAIFLELAHIIIPERGFEIEDLGGNIVGVIISLIIFLIFKPRKKNGFI
jgi:VanZ family protein